MSSATDRILELIDAGLQSSDEHGYPAGAVAEPDTSLCLRCGQHERVQGIEMCEGCRAFLLGDSSDDPAAVNDDFELVNGYGEVVGTIDHVERHENGQIWASGEIDTFTAADPAPTTRWQDEARRHLGDCFDELTSLAAPARQGEPIIVVADDVEEVTRLLSGDPSACVVGLPVRVLGGLVMESPDMAFAGSREYGTSAAGAWFLANGSVWVSECWVCGCPAHLDGYPRDPQRMTLSPCGHSMSDVDTSNDPSACLYQVTIYDSTHLAKVASWLAAWASWIAGEVPEPGPRLATAQRITSTL